MRPATCAIVNIISQDNGTLQDAFQFGTPGDTSWSFVDMSFIMEVKASRNDITPLTELTSVGGQIVVDDLVQRVLHLNVPDSVLQAALPVADYVYDLIMFDTSVPPIRTPLMSGILSITKGVTED